MPYGSPVNLLDLLLVVAVVAAVVGGLRAGFVARAASWLGLVAGFLAATWTVPTSLTLVEAGTPGVRLFTGLLVLAVTVTAVTTLFQLAGQRVGRTIATSPLSAFDRGAGAVLGGGLVVALVWLLVPAAAEVPGNVAQQVRTSRMVAAVQQVTPPPPDTVRALRTMVDSSRFPEVFADLRPAPTTGPPPEEIAVPADVVERATASTVNIEAHGCGRYEGSGFTVASNTVATNAHVVAGATEVQVKRPDGTVRDATVVVFDPDADLALLEVPDLGQDPLPLAATTTGTEGVVIGYPGGQDTPRVAPSRIEDRRTALGRDIYGRTPTERRVLFLAAELQRGDSGSPVVDSDGRVGGVVFAISPDRPTTAYALDLDELEEVLDAPREPGVVGDCI